METVYYIAREKIVETENLRTRFVDNIPGRKWLDLFMKRNPEFVKNNTAEHLNRTRGLITAIHNGNCSRETNKLLGENEPILNDLH